MPALIALAAAWLAIRLASHARSRRRMFDEVNRILGR